MGEADEVGGRQHEEDVQALVRQWDARAGELVAESVIRSLDNGHPLSLSVQSA